MCINNHNQKQKYCQVYDHIKLSIIFVLIHCMYLEIGMHNYSDWQYKRMETKKIKMLMMLITYMLAAVYVGHKKITQIKCMGEG